MNQEKININIEDLISVVPKDKTAKDKTANIHQNYLKSNFDTLEKEIEIIKEFNSLIKIENIQGLEDYKRSLENNLDKSPLLKNLQFSNELKEKAQKYTYINSEGFSLVIIAAIIVLLSFIGFVFLSLNYTNQLALIILGKINTMLALLMALLLFPEPFIIMGNYLKKLWFKKTIFSLNSIEQEIKSKVTTTVAQSIYKELKSTKSENVNKILISQLKLEEEKGVLTWIEFVRNPDNIQKIKKDIQEKMLKVESLESSVNVMKFAIEK